jgi:protein polybromo-1
LELLLIVCGLSWQWRNLPAQEKQCWEERAAKVNEESAAKFAQEEAAALASASPTSAAAMLVKPIMNLNNCSQDQAIENLVFECCWDNCDWQFEDLTDCIDHCIQEPNGHVHQHFANIPPQGKVVHNMIRNLNLGCPTQTQRAALYP